MLALLVILSMFYTKAKVQEYDLFPDTKYGAIWPKPFHEKQYSNVYLYDSTVFEFNITHHKCDLIQKAIMRYNNSMNALVNSTKQKRLEKPILDPRRKFPKILKGLRIVLHNPCEFYPHHEMDESYNLTVSSVSKLTSDSIWGVIRGMETFSQLFSLSNDDRKIFLRAIKIADKPRYPHRGLMLDTSRYYIPVSSIVKTLHTMAMHKLNVLHWRIADDTFLINPMQLPYSKKKIRKLIHHARALGIRIIPEYDLPLHMGPINNPKSQDAYYAMKRSFDAHPFSKDTYIQLQKLYGEVHDIFPEKYLHLGEVDLSNWFEDPKIKKYVEAHHNNVNKLHYLYLQKTQAVLRNGSIPVVWQTSKDLQNNLPMNFIIQTRPNKGWFIRSIQQIHKGRQIISSISINQRHLLYMLRNRYIEYYEQDPRITLYEMTRQHAHEKNVLGIEAIIEPDVLDKNGNIMRSVWVAISAIAEVLWSYTDGTIPDNTLYRMAEQDLRLNLRGAYTGITNIIMHNGEDLFSDLAYKFINKRPIMELKEKDIREWDLLASSLISS